MSFKLILGLFLFCSQAYADEVTSSQPDDNNTSNSSCYFCSLPTPSNTRDLDKLCGDNPYKVVCDNFKPEERNDVSRSINESIAAGEDKVAKSMGFNNIAEAAADMLKKEGIEINPNSLKFKQAIKNGEFHNVYSILSRSQDCYNKSNEFYDHNRGYYSSEEERTAHTNQIRTKLEAARSMVRSEREYLQNILSKNPQLAYENFVQRCVNERNSNYENIKESPLYRKFRDDCNNIDRIKLEAVDLYRMSGDSEEYRRRSREFVDRFAYTYTLGTKHLTPVVPGPDAEIEQLLQNLEQARNTLGAICNDMNKESDVARSLLEDFFAKVHTNKIFVDHVYQNVFKNESLTNFNNVAEAARTSVKSSLDDIIPGSNQIPAIRSTLDNVQVLTPQAPRADLYTRRSDGTYLDESKLTASTQDQSLAAFFDPSLSSLRQFNAYYMTTMGTNSAHVCPVGMALHLATTNPYGIFDVFAHEFGHHFDANVSSLNGFPLTEEYRNLIACYKSNSSINMRDEQKGETTADYVATTVLANELEKVPSNQRRNFYIEALKTYCMFDDENGSLGIDSGSHPASFLRVNGIYTAHPKIRQLLGCTDDNYKYKICPEK